MSKADYIANLTRDLAGRNHFGMSLEKLETREAFIAFAQTQLCGGDVGKMNPATLGRIMCSFEIGDVLASKEELCMRITFAGNCEDLLRELVATCLAYKIYHYLKTMKAVYGG